MTRQLRLRGTHSTPTLRLGEFLAQLSRVQAALTPYGQFSGENLV